MSEKTGHHGEKRATRASCLRFLLQTIVPKKKKKIRRLDPDLLRQDEPSVPSHPLAFDCQVAVLEFLATPQEFLRICRAVPGLYTHLRIMCCHSSAIWDCHLPSLEEMDRFRDGLSKPIFFVRRLRIKSLPESVGDDSDGSMRCLSLLSEIFPNLVDFGCRNLVWPSILLDGDLFSDFSKLELFRYLEHAAVCLQESNAFGLKVKRATVLMDEEPLQRLVQCDSLWRLCVGGGKDTDGAPMPSTQALSTLPNLRHLTIRRLDPVDFVCFDGLEDLRVLNLNLLAVGASERTSGSYPNVTLSNLPKLRVLHVNGMGTKISAFDDIEHGVVTLDDSAPWALESITLEGFVLNVSYASIADKLVRLVLAFGNCGSGIEDYPPPEIAGFPRLEYLSLYAGDHERRLGRTVILRDLPSLQFADVPSNGPFTNLPYCLKTLRIRGDVRELAIFELRELVRRELRLDRYLGLNVECSLYDADLHFYSGGSDLDHYDNLSDFLGWLWYDGEDPGLESMALLGLTFKDCLSEVGSQAMEAISPDHAKKQADSGDSEDEEDQEKEEEMVDEMSGFIVPDNLSWRMTLAAFEGELEDDHDDEVFYYGADETGKEVDLGSSSSSSDGPCGPAFQDAMRAGDAGQSAKDRVLPKKKSKKPKKPKKPSFESGVGRRAPLSPPPDLTSSSSSSSSSEE